LGKIGVVGVMEDNRLSILQNLHELLAHNLLGDKQYLNRYNGFNGELHFNKLYEDIRQTSLLSGGMFISCKERGNHFENAIYVTFSSDNPNSEDYLEIYSGASKLATEGQYFIQYDLSNSYESWQHAEVFKVGGKGFLLPIPMFQVYKFDIASKIFRLGNMKAIQSHLKLNSKPLIRKNIPSNMVNMFIDKFSSFDEKYLLELYLERLFFDGYLGLTYARGAPLDIDCIALGSRGEKYIIEVKEKDLSKRPPRGFGMDIPRINSLKTLSEKLGYKSIYVVREVVDQNTRILKDWHWIYMDDFNRAVEKIESIRGGTGIRSVNSINHTKVCPLVEFKKLVK
jgi:predicted DNA-binding protein